MWGLWLLAAIILLFGFVVFRGAPYVPSKKQGLETAFDELYPLSSGDVLVDIGSGDGVVLRAAAERGARAVGYELNPLLVLISRVLSRKYSNVEIVLADFWHVNLPADTTVVYTFGESRDIAKMATKVQNEATRLERPLLFISYGFAVPGETPVKSTATHHLYRFEPLQTDEA